ncbi:MAG TPA: hypothetical protein VNA66_00525 [Gammaproteobacteria bacterium]|nr:hypothetical protein [Gammaproteobacteria bacterium]
MRAMELRRATARYLGPVVCCTLAACGSGDGFVGSGGVVGPLEPNFDSIQANVFDQYCVHCHSGANAPARLRLDAANSYANLVGVASVETGVLRVAPGNANASYLIQKIEGTAAVGERMPAGLPALPQTDIDIIRQWIGAGALPVSASKAPIRVTSLSPEPSSMDDAMPRSIIVGFDRELNAPSINSASFTLVRAGADGMLGTADDIAIAPASIIVPLANPRAAVMDLSSVRLVPDLYGITLLGSGGAAVLDLSGNALDGEPMLLPSGNGMAGGDFTATFSVAAQ